MNDEATKQMEEIWDKHNDPDEKEKRRMKRIREENLKKYKTDLGI